MSTVASVLADHVDFRVSCVDRIFCQGYIAGLQSEGLVVRFLLDHGFEIPSPVGLRRVHDRLADAVDRFAVEYDVPVVHFARRESKEDAARPYLAAAAAADAEGVVLIGVAQERVSGWRGFRKGGSASHPHFVYRRQSLWVNHYYFYVWDRAFGPGFVKLCPYAPYPVWIWCNGHEWLKRQLTGAGVGFTELDNGIRAAADPARAQQLADRLTAGQVRGFAERWLARLPSPLDEIDRRAGRHYEFSVRQLEISDTAVFDRPRAGRAFFEAAIREHLDLGRPEKVSLVVDRQISRRTPGRFETRVITPGVDPQIQIHYRSSKVKAYFKEHRALRVETTINNPADFGTRKTLNHENWQALLATGKAINARFLAALGEGAPPPPDAATLEQVVLPSTLDGVRAPGLRVGDPRVMALLAAISSFSHVVGGLTNAGLTTLVGALLDRPYTSRQASYDLRRLRRKGFIERLPGHNVYQLTEHGRTTATFLTKLVSRAVVPTLTELQDPQKPPPGTDRPIVTAWRRYEHEVDALLRVTGLAA
jgi:hypothetical protein